MPPFLFFPCCTSISFPVFEIDMSALARSILLKEASTDQLKYRLTAGQSAWASPPSPACTQKRCPEPRLLHSLSLSAQGVPFQEEKIYPKPIREDNGGAIGHSLGFLPKQLCIFICTNICTFGGKVGRLQLPGLTSGGIGAGRRGKATGLLWSQLRRQETHRC